MRKHYSNTNLLQTVNDMITSLNYVQTMGETKKFELWKEEDEQYKLVLLVPGFSENTIKISVDNRLLQVECKKETASNTSNVIIDKLYVAYVPDTAEINKASAVVKDGVLTITIPRLLENPNKPFVIPVKKAE